MSLSPRLKTLLKTVGNELLKEIDRELSTPPQADAPEAGDPLTNKTTQETRAMAREWGKMVEFFKGLGWNQDDGVPLKD